MKTTNWHTMLSLYSKFLFAFFAIAMIAKAHAADPVIIGLADGEWELGELLYETNFDNLDDWSVQITGADPNVTTGNGELELDLPLMGCTVWLKQKFEGPITIVYDAVFPGERVNGDAYRLSDLNNFWHMQDPSGTDPNAPGGLFDDTKFTGDFGDYNPLEGYYASTGGGRNTTTRFRRYPREDAAGTALSHIYLNDRDGDTDYMLTADQKHSVQLVAADGMIQYINDGKVFYEFKDGASLQLSNPDGINTSAISGSDDYPQYDSGYFAFRTVRSHVKYSGLKIYRLQKVDKDRVTVDSLDALVPYLSQDNVSVKLAGGTYRISAQDLIDGKFNNTGVLPNTTTRTFLLVSGNNSIYDFTDVTIEVETAGFRTPGMGEFRELQIIGNNNVLKNLTLVDSGENVRPNHRGQNLVIDGRDNLIEGFHISTKGSYPYGYGDAFGKGSTSTISHNKHSCLLLRGESNHVKNCTLIHRSYGHALFMQGCSNPTVEGCYIEGETRTTDDMLLEEGTGTAADNIGFMTVWGYKLPAGYTKSTGEGGIRAYNGGDTVIDGVVYERGCVNPTIINNTIKDMRTGVTLTHASGTKYVEGCTTIGTERGYAIGQGNIVDCYSDVQHGPAFGVDYDTDTGINAEITIIPHGNPDLPNHNGSKHVAYISGNNHNLTFKTTPETDAAGFEQELEINVGGDVRIISSIETEEDRPGTDIIIVNETGYPLILDDATVNITYESVGPVTDDSVTLKEEISCSNISAFVPLQAEANCESSGIVIPDTGVFALPEYVTEIENGDWIKYESVHFGRGATSLEARASSATAGGNIEVRLGAVDGTLVSTIAIASTGSVDTYAVTAGTLSETIEGTHDIYLVFTGGDGELFDLDYITFTRATAAEENYALSGTATQSSASPHGGPPENAIDGDTNSNWGGGSVTHTEGSEDVSWWEVNLGETKQIGEIVLHPRTGCCPQRWEFFTVSVLDKARNVVFTKSYTHQINGPEGIITNGAIGNVVRVTQDDGQALSIAELQVFPYQYTDTDGDGTMDHEDDDIDGDGVNNDSDVFPFNAAEWADSDNDGIGDNADVSGEFTNISTRAFVTDGNGIMIGGLAFEGTEPMLVLIQGVGSELGENPFGMGDALQDTQIALFQGDVEIASNDDWNVDPETASAISDAGTVTGSFALKDDGKSAAILIELDPGIYTVQFTGKDSTSGVGLVEIYNVSTKLTSD